MKVTLNGGGMNWTWYAELELHEDNTATIIKEWRLHNFDYSQGAGDHPDTDGSFRPWQARYKTSDWKAAGKPGGLTGLKENFPADDQRSRFRHKGVEYIILEA